MTDSRCSPDPEQRQGSDEIAHEIVEHVWNCALEYHSHNPDPEYVDDINIPGWYIIPRGRDGGPGRKLWRLLREYKGLEEKPAVVSTTAPETFGDIQRRNQRIIWRTYRPVFGALIRRILHPSGR